jgi:amidohydrolase
MSAPDSSAVRRLIAGELPSLVEIRHDLHRHPELAYQEKRTSQVVVRELTALGVKHVAGLAGGTGVVAHIPPTDPSRAGRPAVALRADMDALPIEEKTGLAYASTTPGLMHACGHDGHTANLIGVARVLTKLPHRPNPVTLVFQPAEEGGAGAKRLCDEGVLDGKVIGPKVGVIYGLHGWPQYEVGTVGSRPGPLLAATDNIVVTVRGTGAHAAYPQYSRDPIVAAAHCITALQSIVSRNVSPFDSVVVTIATIAGGTARNIIPDAVKFGGTVRTLKPETRAMAKQRLYETVEHACAAYGCRAEIEWEEGYPVTFNDEKATARFDRVARTTLGEARVVEVSTPTMGGEDFSYYAQHVPACFFALGVRPRGRPTYPTLHQPDYDFNDEALETGIESMVALALSE